MFAIRIEKVENPLKVGCLTDKGRISFFPNDIFKMAAIKESRNSFGNYKFKDLTPIQIILYDIEKDLSYKCDIEAENNIMEMRLGKDYEPLLLDESKVTLEKRKFKRGKYQIVCLDCGKIEKNAHKNQMYCRECCQTLFVQKVKK